MSTLQDLKYLYTHAVKCHVVLSHYSELPYHMN